MRKRERRKVRMERDTRHVKNSTGRRMEPDS